MNWLLQSLTPPGARCFPLVAGGANAANVPQVAMRRRCVGRRVPPAACVMHNSLCKGISEPPVISVKDGDCLCNFLCFPARSMTSAYGGGREMETHQLRDILEVNFHFDLLLFFIVVGGDTLICYFLRFPTEWSDEYLPLQTATRVVSTRPVKFL